MAHQLEIMEIPGDSPGTRHEVPIYRFGKPGARPKAYLQAALHADEQPGMMALIHLVDLLKELDAAGKITGEIIVLPAVNPFGLAQITHHTHLGRYHGPLGQNYNRGWPSLAKGLEDAVAGKLSQNADANVAIIRAAMSEMIETRLPEQRAIDKWRKNVLRLAHNADLVLDLHCDEPSDVHIFIMPQLMPEWMDLSEWIGAKATLTAEDSGGGSFDEVYPTPWVAMQRAYPDHPIPLACGAATLELRGREDVSDAWGAHDAANLLGFLGERGVHSGVIPARPALLADPLPLEATTYARPSRPGLISYRVKVGDTVKAGEAIADFIAMDVNPYERTTIDAPIAGTILSTNSMKYVRPGDSIAKVVGTEILTSRTGGYLLED